jgi:hypothetical protein
MATTVKTGKKGSSKVFWIIGGLVLVAGGIGAYFLLRKRKEEKRDVDTFDDDVKLIDKANVSTSRISAPSELNTKDKIKNFQNYVLKIKKNNTILGKSGVDGIWGRNSQNAWDKYKKEYLNSLTFKGSEPASSEDVKIVQETTGSSASQVQGMNQDFVKTLADAKRDNKTAFVWANQVYRTLTGKKVLDWNPRLFNLYSTISGNKLRASASSSSTASSVQKGDLLGKGGGVSFKDNYLYIWLPKKNKWIASIYVSRTKPSSSFDGSDNELLGFDRNFDI